MKYKSGFTLVEILTVVAVISVMAVAVFVSTRDATSTSHDAKRKADLKMVEAAVEAYRLKYGRYPEGCNDVSTNWDGVWSGEAGTGNECSGGSGEYIKNDLSGTAVVENFVPQFLPVLPTDPKQAATGNSGYRYVTNPEGTAFKFMAYNTVEETPVLVTDEFARCGDMTKGLSWICVDWRRNPNGTQRWNNSSTNFPAQCKYGSNGSNTDYQNDFAIYGGWAPGGVYAGAYNTSANAPIYFTQRIWCK